VGELERWVKRMKMKIIQSMGLTFGILSLICGCHSKSDQAYSLNVRFCICTPDGHYYNLESDTNAPASTGAEFHDILLSTDQMSRVVQLLRIKHNLSWQNMTAEAPYPETHTVLLHYSETNPSGLDDLQCSLGTSGTALKILKELVPLLPSSSQQVFQESLNRMEGTHRDREPHR